MKNSRRKFLKTAGMAAVGLGVAPAINLASSDSQKPLDQKALDQKALEKTVKFKNQEAIKAKRWGMVIDTTRINEKIAEDIVHACHKAHNVPDFNHKVDEKRFPDTRPPKLNQGLKWIWEEEFHNAFPEKEDEFLAEKYHHLPFMVTCNHCKNAPCVKACPTQATFKRSDGIVIMDYHRCIGCRFCMAACPYGSRSFNFRDPRPFIPETDPHFPTRSKGVVEKCNFCAERLAKGKQPHCVEASKGAIIVGDLDDPASKIRMLLKENFTIRRNQSLGTEPNVYYIL